MSTLHYKGIVWTTGKKVDGKGTLHYLNCSIVWDKTMGVFQFKQDCGLILARELRADCIRDATDCILETYATEFVPSWEQPDGTAQEAA